MIDAVHTFALLNLLEVIYIVGIDWPKQTKVVVSAPTDIYFFENITTCRILFDRNFPLDIGGVV